MPAPNESEQEQIVWNSSAKDATPISRPVSAVLNEWGDGMQNPALTEYYAEQIEFWKEVGAEHRNSIRYLTYDFDGDGVEDYFTSRESGISGGDDNEILLVTEQGYEAALFPMAPVVNMYGAMPVSLAVMNVMNSKTNGLSDVIFSYFNNSFYATFDGSSYTKEQIAIGRTFIASNADKHESASLSLVSETYYGGNGSNLEYRNINERTGLVFYNETQGQGDNLVDKIYIVSGTPLVVDGKLDTRQLHVLGVEYKAADELPISQGKGEKQSTVAPNADAVKEQTDYLVEYTLSNWTRYLSIDNEILKKIDLSLVKDSVQLNINGDARKDYYIRSVESPNSVSSYILLSEDEGYSIFDVSELCGDLPVMDSSEHSLSVMVNKTDGVNDLIFTTPWSAVYLRYSDNAYYSYPLTLMLTEA
jgi:hypothetical protein